MDKSFRLFPESASTISGQVDALYAFEVAVTVIFTLLICTLILGFGIRYRRGSPASRQNPPASIWLEVTWAAVPLLLTMAMFGWGASVYFESQTPPPDAMRINVIGKQWMWKVQHPNGRTELNELHVPLGQPVQLRMISQDVIHSFYVPAFRLKQDVLPGYYTTMWFEATKTGRFHLFCAEYCGTEHSLMRGRVTVMDADAYAQWLSRETAATPASAGAELFQRFGCRGCHKASGTGSGPALAGIYGSRVPLEAGDAVTADVGYLRRAILDPAEQVVAGYRPMMPSYQGQIDESQVLQLIAYLQTLTPLTRPEAEAAPQ